MPDKRKKCQTLTMVYDDAMEVRTKDNNKSLASGEKYSQKAMLRFVTFVTMPWRDATDHVCVFQIARGSTFCWKMKLCSEYWQVTKTRSAVKPQSPSRHQLCFLWSMYNVWLLLSCKPNRRSALIILACPINTQCTRPTKKIVAINKYINFIHTEKSPGSNAVLNWTGPSRTVQKGSVQGSVNRLNWTKARFRVQKKTAWIGLNWTLASLIDKAVGPLQLY